MEQRSKALFTAAPWKDAGSSTMDKERALPLYTLPIFLRRLSHTGSSPFFGMEEKISQPSGHEFTNGFCRNTRKSPADVVTKPD